MKRDGVSCKTKGEIAILREGGRRLAAVLREVIRAARVGVSTAELDTLAERLILEGGGTPIFKGYKIHGLGKIPYPASICTSINDEVVHGIPRKERILKDGDVLGIDIGMRWPAGATINHQPSTINSLVTDMAVTIGIGIISSEAQRLINATREALDVGIAALRPGARLGDVSHAIEGHLKRAKLGIIRDLAGHGVGYELHEEPLIPNFGKPGTGVEIREGMVLALEPMATLGDWRIILGSDEWTFRTADGSPAAHFEHTAAVTGAGAIVLTR